MKRIPQLDGLRGAAILAVFIHHAFHVKLMWMGVDLFFVLSGFLITGVLLSIKDRPIGSYFGHFYGRRVRRILPSYVISIIVIGLLLGFSFLKNWPFYFGLMNFLKPFHFYDIDAVSSFWSLAVEEQFYLLWPFCVYFLSEKHLKSTACLLISLAPVARGFAHFDNPWAVYMLTPFRMDLLAAGSLLSVLYRSHKQKMEQSGLWIGTVLITAGLIGFAFLSKNHIATYGNTRIGNVFVFECSLFISVGVMVWALSSRYTQILTIKPLTYIGKISYTVYLTHLAFLVFFTHIWGTHKGIVLATLASGLYASLSWYLVEKPILEHRKQPSRRFSSAVSET